MRYFIQESDLKIGDFSSVYSEKDLQTIMERKKYDTWKNLIEIIPGAKFEVRSETKFSIKEVKSVSSKKDGD